MLIKALSRISPAVAIGSSWERISPRRQTAPATAFTVQRIRWIASPITAIWIAPFTAWCSPAGDIDEDDRDSKIACTELTTLQALTRKEFFLHALAYMVDHPGRKVSGKVRVSTAPAATAMPSFEARNPAACGKLGDILAFARERRETEVICQIAVAEVDGEKIQPGVWYDIDFVKREAVQK